MMTKNEIEKLRALSIESVAGQLGLNVRMHRCLCPFHDDHTPSMSLGRNNQYRCWVCGARGDTISLVMRLLDKSFLDACRWLADEHNIITCLTASGAGLSAPTTQPAFDAARYERFFEHPWLNEEARRFLYDERKLDPRVVRWCRLTSWRDKQGVPWLQTPYYDREGRLTGLQNRNLLRGALPRFRFPAGAKCGIYNLPVLNLLRPGEPLYITEGCSDCWAMLSAGHKAIAIPSATLLGREDTALLSSLASQLSTQFHMYPDNDVPGERLFQQLQQLLPSLERHTLPPGCKDFSDSYVLSTPRQQSWP